MIQVVSRIFQGREGKRTRIQPGYRLYPGNIRVEKGREPGYVRVEKRREPGYRLYPGYIRIEKGREPGYRLYPGYIRV